MSRKRVSLQERFDEKYFIAPDSCWVWIAGLDSYGYGILNRGGDDLRTDKAYRISYELHIGDIENGLHLDHLCRQRSCVNPYHLEPVTLVENIMRGEGAAAKNARKSNCIFGHEFTEENTYRYVGKNGTTQRCCIICRRKHDANRRERMGQK